MALRGVFPLVRQYGVNRQIVIFTVEKCRLTLEPLKRESQSLRYCPAAMVRSSATNHDTMDAFLSERDVDHLPADASSDAAALRAF